MNDLLGEYHRHVGRTHNPPREDRELLAVLQKIAADNEDRHRELFSGIWLLFHSMTLTERAVKQLHRTVAHWPVLAMAAPQYHGLVPRFQRLVCTGKLQTGSCMLLNNASIRTQ